MRKIFSARVTRKIPFFLTLCLFFLFRGVNAQCPQGTIKGNVFIDKDDNGTFSSTELGQLGVLVKAYDAAGSWVGQSLTNNVGDYTLSGLANSQSYRLEFEVPSDQVLSSQGQDNKGDIQFVTVPSCSVNMGLLAGKTTCGTETDIFLSCFVNGRGTNSPSQETIIGLVNSFTSSSPVKVYARQSETGAVWGLVYKETTQEIFSGAFVKQHASLASGGHDAIYTTSVSDNPTTRIFANLSSLGQSTGSLSIADSDDCEYGTQVGKIGLGGLVIDDTYQNLYTVNLYNNTVVKIDATNPTASTTEAYAIPNPGCGDDFRAFGLKYHNGSVYVGVTCTAETSQDESRTSVHVYNLNPANGGFTLEFSTDYSRGFWNRSKVPNKRSMQWLTDIDFTSDGNMVLGLSDRLGHVYCNDNVSRLDEQAGDILMVYNDNGTWVLEQNGSLGTKTGTGVSNGQGPGGGEFFGDDFFPGNPSNHPEIALGSVYVLPGSNEVISAVFDPAFAAYSGGLHRYSTLNGSKVGSRELYNQNISKYFGKATGFGDIIAGCGSVKPSLGNYVWIDTDCDGIQDAGEPSLGSVALNLYDESCNLIATTSTDQYGYYAFGALDGVLSGQQYYVTMDQDIFDDEASAFLIDGAFYYPTVSSASTGLGSDLITGPVCSAFNGAPYVTVSATAGNDSSFDIGFKPSTEFDLALRKTNASPLSTEYGDIVDFEIEIFNQGVVTANAFEIVDHIPNGYNFDSSLNPSWTLTASKAIHAVDTPLFPGETYKISILLSLKGMSLPEDLINIAEIYSSIDANGQVNSDIDSAADDNPLNDRGGEIGAISDDLIIDAGTIDEDDHDPAMVYIFDLALDNKIRNNKQYNTGDDVVFDVTVYNQGNIAATSFDLINQFPAGLTFEPALSPNWTLQGSGSATYAFDQPLEVGAQVSMPIVFSINGESNATEFIQYTEISAFTSSEVSADTDFDSTPDTDMFNDIGGKFETVSDDEIFDHREMDEDDHDPAGVKVSALDLALIKVPVQSVINLGDKVSYSIEIHNQGTSVVKKLMLIDFLPAGTRLTDDSWNYSAQDGYASKEILFVSGLLPGETYIDYIEIEISADGAAGAYLNYAEIGEVYNMDNSNVSLDDVDSTADRIFGNDSGGMPATAMDDYLLGDGLDDEDDSDPALVFVPTIEISEACLCRRNATDAFDGQFREELTINSLSGGTWYIDSEFGFYDISSTSGSLVNIITGPGGASFNEFPNGDGTSRYVLSGVILTGTSYSLRATNGSGIFLQVSGGGEACNYTTPTVTSDGLGAVCEGSTHTYSVDTSDPAFDDCVGYSWFLTNGAGTIVNTPGTNATGSGTGMTGSGTGANHSITVIWGSDPGPHELTLIPHCPNDCVAPLPLPVAVTTDGGALACVHELNVSLSDGCRSVIDFQDLLTGDYPADITYQVMLTDASGNLIQNNTLTIDHLWTTVMAKVISPCTGNSCWATINVEDKLPPKIQCQDIEVACYQMDSYEPIVVDNCSTAEYTLISETTTPLPCSSDYIKEVMRTYTAVDGYGNVSAPCTQTIKLLPLDYDNIVIPDNYLVADGTSLSCYGVTLNDEGFPDVSETGIPTLDGQPLYPITDLYCNAGIDYRDQLIVDFGCTRKIMRTWTIYDGCGDPLRRTQTIEISDSRAPWVTCPDNVTVSTSGGLGCQAEFIAPLPEITDDCTTSNFKIDLEYPGGFLAGISSAQSLSLLSSDDNEIIYRVYDQCENVATCTFNVIVMDDVSPVAVCDQNSVVSLRQDGTAYAFPQTFDDGSYDDCSLQKLLVRRMNSDCDCERPVFSDMHYLGERSGRYYYLSDYERADFKTFKYAEAYGGMLVTLESEAEHDWLYEQVNTYAAGLPYFIGLRDKDGNGTYTWANHAQPAFNAWVGGIPSTEGEFVQVNSDGQWAALSGAKGRFVLEVSNPCGFSDKVPFCCADSGVEQMVVLRAVDYFGSYNECMVNVIVQDKVAPVVICPDDVVLDCAALVDVNNLAEYGDATATDKCAVTVASEVINDRNQCGLGQITRVFTASDNTGSSQCSQIISFTNNEPYDFAATVWPLDFDTDLGCDFGALHPDNLPAVNAYPVYPSDACDLVEGTFSDQVFSFAGPDSDACLKILRKWTVIDWCQTDANGYPFQSTYDQTIKVINTVGPEITAGHCDDIVSVSLDCDFGVVDFEVVATDDCTDASQLRNCLKIDLDSDGTLDVEDCLVSNVVSFNNKLPIGSHIAYVSFEDLCGNTTTCAKQILIKGQKPPIAYCKEGISVALEPMDLDDDGFPDNEMACIFPEMLDAGSSHPCGFNFGLSFCNNDPTNKITFDCADRGTQVVTLCVIDGFGNSASCNVNVEVQDNNNVDFCPEFDLALLKELNLVTNPGPFVPGDIVSFRISIFNQGNQDATNIVVSDYIPAGFTLNDATWTQSASSNEATRVIPFLAAGQTQSVSIDLRIDQTYMGDCLINKAEISDAQNSFGLDDRDSNMDNNQSNDIEGGDNVLDNSNNDEDDHDFAKVDVIQSYDLALSKAISASTPSPYMPGDLVSFDIVVTNEGTLDATTVQVSDRYPNGLTLNDASWVINGSNVATLLNPIGFIPAGSSATVTIDFIIDNGFMGTTLVNHAQIIDPDNSDISDLDSDTSTDETVDEDGDGNGDDDDEDSAQLTVGQNFDLALTKVISAGEPSIFQAGDLVNFTITVFNQGSLDASNVEVTDYVPANLIYTQSAINASNGWSLAANPTVILGSIPAGSSATVDIQLQVDPSYLGTSLVNNAEITNSSNALGLVDEDSTEGNNANTPNELATDNDINDNPDNPNDEDDYDPAEIIIEIYDLSLTKTISSSTPGPYMPNSPVSYDITVTNQGTLDATTVAIQDAIPAGLMLNDAAWTQVGSNATLSTPIPLIAAGQSVTVPINFTIDPDFMGTTILNDAQIIDPDGSDRNDIDSNTSTDKTIDEDGDGDGDDDDEDWAQITIGQVFDLALSKTIDSSTPGPYNTGDIVTFAIEVFNQGTLDATDVQVTDYLPSDLLFVNNQFNTDNNWIIGTNGNPVASMLSVPLGTSSTVFLQLQIDPNYTGALIINDAEITSAVNALNLADEDSTPNDNLGTPSELGTDNDVNDNPDNPNDNDDYDPASVDVQCVLEPICSVLAQYTVVLDATGNATINADLIDTGSAPRCDGLDISIALSQTSFSCDDKGSGNIVRVTVTDTQGNVSNNPNCFTDITVVDNMDPTIECQDFTTSLDAQGEPILDLNTIVLSSSDNCSIVTTDVNYPSVIDLCNANAGTITLVDQCGNEATCNFNIFITNEPPVAICEDDFTITLNVTGVASVSVADIDDNSTDDCSVPTLTISQSTFDCTNTGPNTVTLTATDMAGTTSQCSVIVTVEDNAPTISCLGTYLAVLDGSGNVSISESDLITDTSDDCGVVSQVIDITTFDCDDAGTATLVTSTVTDTNGNMSTCTTNVTVTDNENPVIECVDISTTLDATGNPIIVQTSVVTSTSDNCSFTGPILDVSTIDLTTIPCTPQNATYTITDPSGNIGVCAFTIAIMNAPPVAICNDDFSITLDANGQAMITATDIDNGSTDDCTQPTLEIDLSSFDCTTTGLNTVTLTVTDVAGSTSQCSVVVTVEDNVPTITCLATYTAELDGSGNVTISQSDLITNTSDDCGVVSQVIDITEFDCDDILSPTTVTSTVTDSNGNTSTCTTIVTVVDGENPVIECQDISTELDTDGNPVIVQTSVVISTSDNCNFTGPILDISNIDLATLQCTPQDATYTITDPSGNIGVCTFSISIIDAPPVALCVADFTLSLDSNGEAMIMPTDIDNGSSDDCSEIALAISQLNFDCDDVGANVIMLSVFDNNTPPQTTQCSTTVTIEDNTPPEAICQSITVEVAGNGIVDIVAAQIDNGSNDACGLAANPFTLSQTRFECAGKGLANNVTLTVIDANGNASSCDATVTIEDNIDPTVSCRANRFVDLDENGGFEIQPNFIITNSNDNCDIVTTTLDQSIFTCDDKANGVTVTATVTDASGNSATCSTDITVRDLLDPTCILQTGLVFNLEGDPPVVNLELSDVLAVFNDNCASVPASSNINPANFDCDDIGMQTINVTVDDGCNNQSSCTTQIEIVDVTVPTCEVIEDVTFDLDPNGNFFLTPADINISSTAGCDANASLELSQTDFACNNIPLSPNCVILTVTSANGNSATCKSNVTFQDVTPPSADCVASLSVTLDDTGVVSITSDQIVTAADECGMISEVLSVSEFECADKGAPIVVTATVTDVNGNTNTCTTEVTVTDDIDPTCTLQSNLTFDLIGMPPSVTIELNDILATYNDNCPGPATSSTITPATFDCSTIGDQIVTVVVEDACGNTGECSTTVLIADNSVPICLTQDISITLDATGNYVLDPTEIDAGSNAGCGTNVFLSADPTDLDCSNIGDNTITLTVTTSGGVMSTCTAIVTVVDETDPVITCPDDLNLPCNSDISDLTDFGLPSAVDGCGMVIINTLLSTINVNVCNVGVITRPFVATDEDGNTASCTQIVTIDPPQMPLTVANITWPQTPFTLDACIPDPNNIISGMPIVDESGVDCSNVSISQVTVDPTPNQGTDCVNTFERTWTVIDSCQIDGSGGGIFTFVQTIILNDVEGPEIICPSDTEIFLPANATSCEAFVNLPALISDCTGILGGTNDSPFADDNNSSDASGLYEGGTVVVNVSGTDVCGNTSMCSFSVSIIDANATIDTCKKIIEQIGPNGTSLVTLDQACVTIDGVCPDSAYTLSYSGTSNSVSTILVDCSMTAPTVPSGIGSYTIYLWVGNTVLDSCTNLLQVLDPMSFCTQPLGANIAGSIYTEDDRMVSDVSVMLETMNMMDMTDEVGHYGFEDMYLGEQYEVIPNKDIDYLNGVSTLDLIMIQRHILGVSKFDSPYKLIAADINRSGDINGIDMVELRKLILGIYEELPGNTSWRMVDAAHTFVDPLNPFISYIPESYRINDFQSDMDIDFIGVKIGDINGDVIANLNDINLDKRRRDDFAINVSDDYLTKGQEATISFTVADISQLLGFQFNLEFDNSIVEFIELQPVMEGLSLANANVRNADSGSLVFSWNAIDDLQSMEANQVLFKLRVALDSDAWISDIFSISQSDLSPEAYIGNEIQNVTIAFEKQQVMEEVRLYQNNPNPWTQTTSVMFSLPINQPYTLNVYNVDGAIILSRQGDGLEGMNTLMLSKADLLVGGLYYYELVTEDQNLTSKMLFIK